MEGSLRPLHFGTGGALGRNSEHSTQLPGLLPCAAVSPYAPLQDNTSKNLGKQFCVHFITSEVLSSSIPCQHRARTSKTKPGAILEVGDIPISPGLVVRRFSLLTRPSTSTPSITTDPRTPPQRQNPILHPKHHDSRAVVTLANDADKHCLSYPGLQDHIGVIGKDRSPNLSRPRRPYPPHLHPTCIIPFVPLPSNHQRHRYIAFISSEPSSTNVRRSAAVGTPLPRVSPGTLNDPGDGQTAPIRGIP